MIYLTSVLSFGLLQIWILLGFLTFKGVNYDKWDLVKDGGLFIFATSLAITTFIHHRKVFKRAHENETYWSFFITAVIMLICSLGFLTGININTTKTTFDVTLNPIQNAAQVIGSVFAIGYGLIIEKRVERAIR